MKRVTLTTLTYQRVELKHSCQVYVLDCSHIVRRYEVLLLFMYWNYTLLYLILVEQACSEKALARYFPMAINMPQEHENIIMRSAEPEKVFGGTRTSFSSLD